jgi:hypothetical protein
MLAADDNSGPSQTLITDTSAVVQDAEETVGVWPTLGLRIRSTPLIGGAD